MKLGWLACIGLLLVGVGCTSSMADHCGRFDQMVLPPEEGKPYGALRYQESGLVGDQLLELASPQTSGEIMACSLRLLLVCNRDDWAFNRLLALQSLGRIAAQIGPGPPPPFPGTKTRIASPELGPAFRQRLAAEVGEGKWSTLHRALRQVFVKALFDSSLEVRNGGVEILSGLWGARGIRCAFAYLSAQERKQENRALLFRVIALCRDISPSQARDSSGDAPSIFFLLHQFTQFPPLVDPAFESLAMVTKHAICRIMQVEPRYDRDWFDKWWQEELALQKQEKGS